MDRYTPENRHLLTYEGLTDDLIGAEVAKGLNEFLGQVEGVDTIDQESVPCIWRAVVKNKPPPEQAAQIAKLQSLALNKPQSEQVSQPQGPPYSPPEQQQSSASEQQGPPYSAPEQKQPAPYSPPEQQGPPYSAPEQQQPAPYSPPEQQQSSEQQGPPYSSPGQLQPAPYSPPEQQPSPLLRRRLDLGHHDSQRKGPKVPRPYTSQQLDTMMNMLLEIGERYKSEDVRLYHIMMGYYEKVREARIKTTPDESVAPPPGGYF